MTDGSPGTTDDHVADVGEASGLRRRVRHLGALLGRVPDRVPARWTFVVAMFLGTKLVLTLVGLIVLRAHDDVAAVPPPDDAYMRQEQREVSSHRWISMWFAWDSFHYDDLARVPLDGPWRFFAFPLLYPFLGRAVAVVLGGDTALALLLISNVALLFLLYNAHRLGELLLGDDASARRFTKYVMLLPAAFIFQAALTESLFACLALAAFVYAEQRRWLLVGIVGFFLALSRSTGFLVVIPLALILLQQQRYGRDRAALSSYLRAAVPLAMVPAGWLSFMAFSKWQSGDWFAYQHAQQQGWKIVMHNPLRTVRDGLTVAEPRDAVRVWFAVVIMVLAVAAVKQLTPAYTVYTLLMVLTPLSIGPPAYKSLLRYLLAAFPICLLLARWARRATVDTYLTAGLALVQGALFVLWLTYWTHFII